MQKGHNCKVVWYRDRHIDVLSLLCTFTALLNVAFSLVPMSIFSPARFDEPQTGHFIEGRAMVDHC